MRFQYQLKLVTKTREKNVATNLRKMGLKFQNPSFKILWKIAFWNEQKGQSKELLYGVGCAGKKTACLMGQP